MPVSPGWSLPLVGQDYLEILSSWYCSFGKCCETGDCRIANNITGLELDLSRRLHGQHLAKDVILRAMQGFLETTRPEKALALSFHGWSGTGKNFVARMIADHLYRDGLKSECVKVFISLFHFPHPKYVDLYKVQLKKQISETVQLCKQSLFIFDETEKLHSGLLDAIKPYVDHYDSINEVDYRRSIFLFLSNIGGNIINQVTLDFWRAGRAREEITMEYLEQHLRMELLESTDFLKNGMRYGADGASRLRGHFITHGDYRHPTQDMVLEMALLSTQTPLLRVKRGPVLRPGHVGAVPDPSSTPSGRLFPLGLCSGMQL
ncbi:torsin-3A isoform X3 [Chelonia mydas]|uniref:torsin-3A isoform X3 n=1 Tax=Chelonia mydas TaxID=8469 RepID=UPI001CA7FA03|nr:torsin-3A isoform X3 [Chelonia mydas]